MKFRAQLDSVLEKTLVVIMSAMVINVLWQVFFTLYFNQSQFVYRRVGALPHDLGGCFGSSLCRR